MFTNKYLIFDVSLIFSSFRWVESGWCLRGVGKARLQLPRQGHLLLWDHRRATAGLHLLGACESHSNIIHRSDTCRYNSCTAFSPEVWKWYQILYALMSLNTYGAVIETTKVKLNTNIQCLYNVINLSNIISFYLFVKKIFICVFINNLNFIKLIHKSLRQNGNFDNFLIINRLWCNDI